MKFKKIKLIALFKIKIRNIFFFYKTTITKINTQYYNYIL